MFKKWTQRFHTMIATLIAFFAFSMPTFAQGVTGGPTQLQVQSAAQKIVNLLNTFGLPYIEAGVSIGISVLTIVGVIKASRNRNVVLMWTEISFGFIGIILVLNPLLLINSLLTVGSWFGGQG